ncbi:RNA-guided endonuclease InsQ/TnpB family protein [Streptomyces sp. NPDC004296]|uniref:RNA-guided endonuclease InsQ/TnpB family protein n=1 Tax=Streptomyces sp. NPDC004296 TaxID=3364697 RepID=UPI003677B83D
MRRSYKFLLRPTVRQQAALSAMLADHCTLYNGALQERRGAWLHPSRTRIRYTGQSAQLKEIRAADPDLARWSFSSQQSTLRRLNRAFEAFFRRVKAGQAPGHPRFRSFSRFDTVEWPRDGDGCKWDPTPHDVQTRVRLQGVGHVRVHQHRPVRGRVKTIGVKREGARWFVVLSCDGIPTEPLPTTGREVGIDMGITHFVTTSDGQHFENPRHLANLAEALAAAQRTLDSFPKRKRARDRSKAHRLAIRRVAKLHTKVRRQRLDHAHKTALALVRQADVIAHENLSIKAMIRRPTPKPTGNGTYEPNGAAAKTGLNRAILDAGWGVFLGVLADKAECAGRELIPVDPRNSSRQCPQCGYTAAENRDRERFECRRCGHGDHADRIGALNTATRAGLALCVSA